MTVRWRLTLIATVVFGVAFVAGAGSGKTETLVARVAALVRVGADHAAGKETRWTRRASSGN